MLFLWLVNLVQMVVGDMDFGFDSQANFLLWDVILVDGEDKIGVEGSQGGCVVESKRRMVVVEEQQRREHRKKKKKKKGDGEEESWGENHNILFMSLMFHKRSNIVIPMDKSSFSISNLDSVYGNDNIETFVKHQGHKQNKKKNQGQN